MADSQRTRRAYLAAVAVPAVGAIAGCHFDVSESGTPTQAYSEALGDRTVAVSGDLPVSFPDAVRVVEDPAAADLVVLPATTERSAERIVGWIQVGTRVALVGDRCQATWLAVQDSEAYATAYPDHRARGVACSGSGSGSGDAVSPTDCEPPDMLVAWEHPEGIPTTYRRTWGGTDDPNDAQVLAGLAAAYEDP